MKKIILLLIIVLSLILVGCTGGEGPGKKDNFNEANMENLLTIPNRIEEVEAVVTELLPLPNKVAEVEATIGDMPEGITVVDSITNILDVIGDTLINKYLKYSTLMWGLIPSGQYKDICRDKYLAGDDMAAIREQADWYYKAQMNSDRNIQLAKFYGVDVFDIVDTNVTLYQLASSYKTTQADGIIQVDSTSMGAYSVNVGTKLPADYDGGLGNCKNKKHDHTDPEGIIDARQGLLPDHTFYFSGQNHATTASNDVLMSLIIHLLTDESFKNVFSYPEKFPQFNYSRETLQLRKDVDTMRTYDTSSLSTADATELAGAIKQVDDMLAVTIIDPAVTKAASDRFYAIYDKINGNGGNDTSVMICTATKAICSALYTVYGDAAYSEMPLLTIQMIMPSKVVY